MWLWMVYGGWRGYYHAICEPWTGYPSPLAEAASLAQGVQEQAAARRARWLGP